MAANGQPPPPGGAPTPGVNPQVVLSLAKDNKWKELKALVAQGVPVNTANPLGQTALHIAALWGNIATISALIQLGADVNATNQRGCTALHFAACAKQHAKECCQLLLQAGANPHMPDMMGFMPFERAELPEVRVMLGGPDQRLFDFAAQGKAQELGELLASGAISSLKVVDSHGAHALNLAVNSGSRPTVEVLLQRDPEMAILPDMTGNTPLHIAAEMGSVELVTLLLGFKPGVNEHNLNLNEYSHGDWLSGEETIQPVDKTPLHLAVESGSIEVVRLLLDAGAAVTSLDYDGCTPLHLALQEQEEEIIQLLLQRGADPNQASKDSTSPLHSLAQRGPLKLLELLLQHKADPQKAGEDGWTPLHLAARAGAGPKVAALLAAGAWHGAANAQGNTPLHLASVNGHVAVVQQLVAAGADSSVANAEGRTPVDMAKSEQVKQALAAAAAS